MNKIKRIILDVDHTICNSDNAFIKAYCSRNGITPLGFQTKKWDFTDCIPNIDKSLIIETFATDLFFEFLEPYPYVVEEIAKVREMGIEVIVASQCSPLSVGKKAQWIERHFPKIGQYPKIDWGKDKSYLALGEGDLFIDDMPQILDSVSAEYKMMFQGIEGRDWQEDYDGVVMTTWKNFSGFVRDFNSSIELINDMRGDK